MNNITNVNLPVAHEKSPTAGPNLQLRWDYANLDLYRSVTGDAPAFPTPVIPTPTIPTPVIPTQVNEYAKQQAMASVRFYGRGINKDSKPPVMCVTGVDPGAEPELFFCQHSG